MRKSGQKMSGGVTAQQTLRRIPSEHRLCVLYRKSCRAAEIIKQLVGIHPVQIPAHPFLGIIKAASRMQPDLCLPEVCNQGTDLSSRILRHLLRLIQLLHLRMVILFFNNLYLIVF